MKTKTTFKNVGLGFLFRLPGDKETLYQKVSNKNAVPFRYRFASKKTEKFSASKVVKIAA